MARRALRSAIITAADWLAVRSGASSVIARRYGGLGSIFMFHRIVAEPRRQNYPDSEFSEAGLARILRHCRDRKIRIVDMDEAIARLHASSGERFVVFTFDDGYRDNYTRALKIFEAFGAPFTVYVSTGIVERTLFYWWGGLSDLFQRHDRVEIEQMGRRFELRTPNDRQNALFAVVRWVGDDVETRSESLKVAFDRYGVDTLDLLDRHALSVDELRALARNPLVTIGGHSTAHRPLASLEADEARQDIFENKAYLQEQIEREVAHFAYPFGKACACGWREARLVQEAGYRTAVSTLRGNLFPIHADEPYMLPRGSMNPMREHPIHADAQFAGVHRLIESRFGAPIPKNTVPPHGGAGGDGRAA